MHVCLKATRIFWGHRVASYFRIKNFRISVLTSISAVSIFEVSIFRSSYVPMQLFQCVQQYYIIQVPLLNNTVIKNDNYCLS